jgi:hypothetical protein
MLLINKFISNLKQSNGDWSKNGIQRIVRLSSECSEQFVSLRNYKIKADVPLDEAFKDPYSKIFYILLRNQIFFHYCNYFISLKLYFILIFFSILALIEQQIYRKLVTLKSKQTNKYICYDIKSKIFVLKVIYTI